MNALQTDKKKGLTGSTENRDSDWLAHQRLMHDPLHPRPAPKMQPRLTNRQRAIPLRQRIPLPKRRTKLKRRLPRIRRRVQVIRRLQLGRVRERAGVVRRVRWGRGRGGSERKFCEEEDEEEEGDDEPYKRLTTVVCGLRIVSDAGCLGWVKMLAT